MGKLPREYNEAEKASAQRLTDMANEGNPFGISTPTSLRTNTLYSPSPGRKDQYSPLRCGNIFYMSTVVIIKTEICMRAAG